MAKKIDERTKFRMEVISAIRTQFEMRGLDPYCMSAQEIEDVIKSELRSSLSDLNIQI